ncbi:MAG: hypothetical protein AAF941_04295 [Pseudomonadota bacterium]
MTRVLFATLAAAVTLTAAPLTAGDEIFVDRYRAPIAPNNDTNSWWLDFKTDISEAKRELRSDLRRATDEEDRRDAYAEYRREIADARYDYRKEMNERGYRVVNFKQNRRYFAER